MKEKINKTNPELVSNELELSCGNCWGHQEYIDRYVDKTIDINRDNKDNFLSRFVKKYLK